MPKNCQKKYSYDRKNPKHASIIAVVGKQNKATQMMVNYLNKVFEMQQDYVNLDPTWEILEGYPNSKEVLEKIEEGEKIERDDLQTIEKPIFSTYPKFYT